MIIWVGGEHGPIGSPLSCSFSRFAVEHAQALQDLDQLIRVQAICSPIQARLPIAEYVARFENRSRIAGKIANEPPSIDGETSREDKDPTAILFWNAFIFPKGVTD